MGPLEEALAQKALLVLVGMVGSIVAGCLVYFVKVFYEDGRKRIKDAKKAADQATITARDGSKEARGEVMRELKDLRKDFAKFQNEVIASYSRLKEKTHQLELKMTTGLGDLKTRLEVASKVAETETREIHQLEGRVNEHMGLISQFITTAKELTESMTEMRAIVDQLKQH